MITVVVGDNDVCNRLASQCVKDRGNMRINQRPRVDDSNLVLSYDVRASANKGEWRWIRSGNSPNVWCYPLNDAIFDTTTNLI